MANGVLRTAFLGARLLDPESGLDVRGDLLAENGKIADFGPGLFKERTSAINDTTHCPFAVCVGLMPIWRGLVV